MAKKKPTTADANQDNGAKPPKKPRAKKVPPEQFATNAIDYPEPDECPDCKMHQSLCKCANRTRQAGTSTDSNATPKNQIGLGWFAGSLHEMTREEHIAKLRHFQEHGSFPTTTATEPTTETQNTSIAPITIEGTTNQDEIGETAGSTTADRIAEATTQTEADASAENQGDVPVSVAETGSTYTAKQLELAPLARVRNGETRGQCWERLRREGRAAGMTRRGAIAYAGGVIDSLFPPPEPAIVEELPAAEPPDESAMSTIVDIPEEPVIEAAPPAPVADMGVKGLGEMPESWGTLPANAQLQVEIAWVSANRLRVRDGTGVNLSRALSPAPSYSALSWLETSILFPSKFADISVKATAQQDDEREGIRREKLAIEEIRGLLAEMLEG